MSSRASSSPSAGKTETDLPGNMRKTFSIIKQQTQSSMTVNDANPFPYDPDNVGYGSNDKQITQWYENTRVRMGESSLVGDKTRVKQVHKQYSSIITNILERQHQLSFQLSEFAAIWKTDIARSIISIISRNLWWKLGVGPFSLVTIQFYHYSKVLIWFYHVSIYNNSE